MSRVQSLRKPLIALLLGLSLIAAACGSSEDADGVDTPSPGDEATSSTEANEPDNAGDYDPDATLRVAYLFVPTTLDPHMKRHIGDRPGLLPIWDTLLTLDDNRNVAPWLATEWDFDEAGTLLTFTLRDDVVFHDGSPADAYGGGLDQPVARPRRCHPVAQSAAGRCHIGRGSRRDDPQNLS